ncbi:MAG: cytochrome c oxidase assembly protein [Limimaricola soesokkakensis]|uniref:Cytochrome c oxidase caa3 assembly factor (Caa3_CtaG) n=1 Tax=Limimaricola soesokkakensis TaxID=1343159 RepID=A0A1X6YZ34_9RHOB|nr:cytochrome c oxidase assembly protein [Limimaricola soesokkakensis]PSK87871.1 putative membrane protein [Limimaricola soesokkakensis]SLN35334.1 Cytochrome c oxidase caa3 assembly factor (Caa3_CtaG) [Limimaricola soesokkakensis]
MILGLGLLAAVWVAPLEMWLGSSFAGHMLRHMTIVALAAPLLVLGWPALGRALALGPLIAAALEFAVVWAWHLPRAHALAYRSEAGFAAEQASFLLAGLLVWAGCLRAGHPLAGAGGLLLTSMHMTLLGALLILAPRDLYSAWCGLMPDLGGQQLGGMLMLGIGTPVYLVAGLALTARAVKEREAAA